MLLNRVAFVVAFACMNIQAAERPPTVRDLKNPESAVVGNDGRVYVSEIGAFDKDGDGRIAVVENGSVRTFAAGLDDPKGLDSWRDWLFVTDKTRVLRIDARGRSEVIADADDFPRRPLFLNDLLVHSPGRMLVVDLNSGNLYLLDVETGSTDKLSGGYGGGDGIARDSRDRTYVSDYANGRVFVIDSLRARPRQLAADFQTAADIAVAPDGEHLLVPDMKAGELIYLSLP
jgi:sugar lactone lactonase YvrE